MLSLDQHGHFGGFPAATNAPALSCRHAPSIRIVGACAWLLLLPSFGRSADAQLASAAAIKAAFVLSFMKFVEWPGTALAAPDAPLVLCVSGARSDPGDTANMADTALTMGDGPGIAAAGAMIGLYFEDGRIQFEINAGSVQASAIKLISQLMKLARITDRKRSGDSK